ncbi:MAG: ion channel [Thermodesulfobacteriota bacterium]
MFSKISSYLKELRFLQLTIYLLLLLIIWPLMDVNWFFAILVEFFLINSLLVSLSALGPRIHFKWFLWISWCLGTSFYILSLITVTPEMINLCHILDIIFSTLFILCCVLATLIYIFRSEQVTLDTIFAAVMTFLLLAFAYSLFYQFILALNPHAFKLPLAMPQNPYRFFQNDMIYFSLVTITTLGYGDIVPVIPVARMIAVVEAVTGHFYVAILVAWLVGMFISQSLRSGRQGVDQDRQ